MKHKLIIVLFLILVVAIGTGIYCKSTYKDFNDENNVLNNFVVAGISNSLLEKQIELMNDTLCNSKIIIAAECRETFTYRYACVTQQIEVLSVFKGEEIREGDIIDIARASSLVSTNKDSMINGKYIINMGFVNEMIPGKTYLIFLDRKLDILDGENIFIQSEEYLLAPIFCYENIVNDIPVQEEDDAYINYEYVRNNEFFIREDISNDKIQIFKDKILSEYMYLPLSQKAGTII